MEKYSYLAGVLDVQGQLLLRPIDKVSILISTVDLEYLGFLQREYGGEITIRKSATPETRTVYRWTLSDRQLVMITLEGILPYLHTSMQPQADILLQYLSIQPIRSPHHRATLAEYRTFQQVDLALKSLRNLGRPGWEVPYGD